MYESNPIIDDFTAIFGKSPQKIQAEDVMVCDNTQFRCGRGEGGG